MQIVLLTQWYPPEPGRVLPDLAESLRTAGHDVTVLTGFPNYPSGHVYPGYRIRWRQRETIGGVPIVRVPLYPNHSRSAAKRVANYFSFATSAALLGPWLLKRPDLVYVYHPPLTIAGPAWFLSRLWRVPFVYEVQDLWPETLRATGMLANERLLRVVGWAARWAYRRAAAIRVISPGFRDNLIAKGVPAGKIHVISNWVDTEYYRPVEADTHMAAQLGLTDRFNVMFAGTIGLAQGIDTLLDAAVLLRDDATVQFVLVGDGADCQRVRQAAADRGLANVRFLGRYPGDAMPGLYALADVLLLHLRDDPLFRITIPHKIFTYMACAKPVLAAIAGDAATVVSQSAAGLTCPPGNPQAMAELVRRFRAMNIDERNAIGQRARQAACVEYGRQHLIAQVLRMIETIVPQSRRKSVSPP